MRRAHLHTCIAAISLMALFADARGQNVSSPKVEQAPASAIAKDSPESLPPLANPATIEQIDEYLKVSGEMESFRARWIAALDKNRPLGAPYWPESFWKAVEDEMQKTDLLPMYIELFQHGISKDLMGEVLDTYRTLGAEHFRGSPACVKLSEAELALSADMDKLKLAETQKVVQKVYAIYRPQIKAARARYLAEHPDWKDK